MGTGFDHVGEWATSPEEGRYAFATLRKIPSQATVARWWVDLSMAAGIPRPNYYAAEPLVAAELDGMDGIYHGTDQSPYQKHLATLLLTTPTAGLVGQYMLMDYLLFYPFVDGDAAGETQTMDNTVTLSRYTDGEGVMAMAVAVSPMLGGGSFTFDYVNQDGDPKTSPTATVATTAAGISSIITSQPAVAGQTGPFLRLASGDTGIRSISAVNVIGALGGLFALVLVRPLANHAIREINTPSEMEYVSGNPAPPKIHDGAYLNMIVNCAATVAAGTLSGFAETYWSED